MSPEYVVCCGLKRVKFYTTNSVQQRLKPHVITIFSICTASLTQAFCHYRPRTDPKEYSKVELWFASVGRTTYNFKRMA